ncbi:hypothetical protein L7F22_057559 [Adiantum nelumboides]|nr:hypothetical protein [Adiantum nelumboides]
MDARRGPSFPFHLDMGQLQKHLTGLTDAIMGAAKPLFRFQEELRRRGASAAASPAWNQWSPRPKSRHNPALMPCFASISSSPFCSENAGEGGGDSHHIFDIALSQEQVSKTLEGVPVYTVSNSGNEFVLVSDPEGSKSLSLLCFRQQDAEALLTQVRDREPVLGREARVVSVPLEKVYKLSAEGIAFRFLPDPVQVKNAIETRVKSGDKTKAFDGVPVFQSENLVLKSSNRRYIPIFFQKEDLEKALVKASKEMYRSNPAFRAGINIQVGSLEDVLKRLEVNDENSGWSDFVFVPPGRDAVKHLGKALG